MFLLRNIAPRQGFVLIAVPCYISQAAYMLVTLDQY